MEMEPVTASDGFIYQAGQLTKKAAEAVRAIMTPGEVDDNTRPILEKWEVKARANIGVSIAVPDPPNWKTAVLRSGGGSGGGWGSTQNTGAFLAAAANPKNKNKGKSKQRTSAAGAGDEMLEIRVQEVMTLSQAIQQNQVRLYEQQDAISNAVAQVNQKLQERDAIITQLSQYLYSLTGATELNVAKQQQQPQQQQQQQTQQSQPQVQAIPAGFPLGAQIGYAQPGQQTWGATSMLNPTGQPGNMEDLSTMLGLAKKN